MAAVIEIKHGIMLLLINSSTEETIKDLILFKIS